MATRIGVQLHPQHCTYEEIIGAAEAIDKLGVDTLWIWDHFYPLYGESDSPMPDRPQSESPNRGDHFEAWTLLTAMACRTKHAEIGHLVGCNSYRNPHLVADMARTLDHISGGRLILGLGSGWFERDYKEYEFEFGTAASRLKDLGKNLPVILERLKVLTPRPVRNPMPLMIGGGGEKVTLKLVGKYATMWNGFGPPAEFKRKNEILDQWCRDASRNPQEVERTVALFSPDDLNKLDEFVEAGAEHIILGLGWPFKLDDVNKLVEWRAKQKVAR